MGIDPSPWSFSLLVLKVMLGLGSPSRGHRVWNLSDHPGNDYFQSGSDLGLSKLGEQSGGLVPAAFMGLESVKDSPLYIYGLGLFIALAFAWALGFGATLAEPALNALGGTVENLTNGVFKKTTLMFAVSLGVAFGLPGTPKLILTSLSLGSFCRFTASPLCLRIFQLKST